MLQRIFFWLGHWCLNYDEYTKEVHAYHRIFQLHKIRERGYTEKTDLEAFYEHPPKGRKQEVRTSGSTGVPIRFWCNSQRIASSLALIDHRLEALGRTRQSVFMKFWYPTTGHNWWQMLKERFYRWYSKERFFSYFDFINGKKNVMDFIEYVNKHKPDILEGYAGGLIAIASFIRENKITIHPIGVVVTGAGRVTSEQHELLEAAFGCKHYDRYGCSEFGEIAHQMGNGYYEPNPHLEIEVSRDLKTFYPLEYAQDGNYEIFVTDPRNTVTPFWRYRMYDVVSVINGKIVSIDGRTERMYEIAGQFIPTGFFYQALKDFPWIDQWQVQIHGNKIVIVTNPRVLNLKEQRVFEGYFDTTFSFKYTTNNFITVGRRKKIAEIVAL